MPGLSIATLNRTSLPEEEDQHNRYLYNGKELQDDNGLGWYDYGARYYDPQVGRWWSMDPLAERYTDYSAYVYTMADPVRFYDVMGMAAADELWKQLGDNTQAEYVGSEGWKEEKEEKKNEGKIIIDTKNNTHNVENSTTNTETQSNIDKKIIMLVGLGLTIDEAKKLISLFQVSNIEIKMAAIQNNIQTKAIDNIIKETGKTVNGIKWIGRGAVVIGGAISIYQGYEAYTKKDTEGMKRAGLDLGIGVISAVLGGVPGVLMYGGYTLMMQPPQGDTGYRHPDIFLNDNTNVSINTNQLRYK